MTTLAYEDTDPFRFVEEMKQLFPIHYDELCVVQPHLHYKSCKTAFEDIYFITKEYRKGRIGIKLFQYAEEVLKGIGVNRIIMHTKIHLDNSRLFERLGYTLTDKLFTKLLG
jgi:GNAT superfamily N-acetyltransferase